MLFVVSNAVGRPTAHLFRWAESVRASGFYGPKFGERNMKRKKSLLFGAVLIILASGCRTTGRYQTVVSDGMAVMTDTVTGQAWASPCGQPVGFLNKDFGNPKRR